ncbi:unnamed protein product [Sphagnum compactum]
MASKASRWSQQWFRPEILPLFLAVGTGLGISGFAVMRNFAINPDVRLNKEDRKAGILENYEEGQTYQEHSFRTLLRDRRPEIMPSFNDFLSKPK